MTKRVIKFRAYQKTASLHHKPGMYYVNDIVWYNETSDGYTGEVFFDDGSASSEYLEDVELMQFTGLLDKNGKEIYEGDIVRFKEEDGKKTIGEVRMGKKNMAWSFYLPEAGTGMIVPMLNFIHGMLSLVPDYDFEVIGNIYENGDLL